MHYHSVLDRPRGPLLGNSHTFGISLSPVRRIPHEPVGEPPPERLFDLTCQRLVVALGKEQIEAWSPFVIRRARRVVGEDLRTTPEAGGGVGEARELGFERWPHNLLVEQTTQPQSTHKLLQPVLPRSIARKAIISDPLVAQRELDIQTVALFHRSPLAERSIRIHTRESCVFEEPRVRALHGSSTFRADFFGQMVPIFGSGLRAGLFYVYGGFVFWRIVHSGVAQ